MVLELTIDELLAWTAEERVKWHTWLKANPDSLGAPVQPEGRFATVGSLVDHIFLVEVRHTLRLQRVGDLPITTGVPPGDIDGLFAYAAEARKAVKTYLQGLTSDDAATPRDVVVQSGSFPMTPRKLIFHMALHEVRHWAQTALAVRMAGFTPPGDHDLFYSKAMV